MTIGDVLAVFLALILSSMAWIAALTIFPLLFPAQVDRAESALRKRPRACLLVGLIAFAVCTAILVVLWGKAFPVVRILVFAGAAYEAYLLAAGCAAICSVAASRLAVEWPKSSVHTSRLRTAALFTAAGWVPAVGWFIALPVAAAVGFGASLMGMFGSKSANSVSVSQVTYGESLT